MALDIPPPWVASDDWDTLSLGTHRLPGIVQVDVAVSDEMDVKKPQGGNGATTTRKGENPAKGTIRIQIQNDDQWADWVDVLPQIWPRNNTRRTATPYQVDHPKFALYGIDAINISDIKDGTQKTGDSYVVVLEWTEHRPPPKNAKTAVTTKKIPEFTNILAEGARQLPPSKQPIKP
jgi:hypothetical protein